MPGSTHIISYNPQSRHPTRQELLSPVFYRWGNWGAKGWSQWPEDTKLTSSTAWIWTQAVWVKSHTTCTAVYTGCVQRMNTVCTGCVHWMCNVHTGRGCEDVPLGLFVVVTGEGERSCRVPRDKNRPCRWWYSRTGLLGNHEKWCYRKKCTWTLGASYVYAAGSDFIWFKSVCDCVFCICIKDLRKDIKGSDKIGCLLERQLCDCGQKLERKLFFSAICPFSLLEFWIMWIYCLWKWVCIYKRFSQVPVLSRPCLLLLLQAPALP